MMWIPIWRRTIRRQVWSVVCGQNALVSDFWQPKWKRFSAENVQIYEPFNKCSFGFGTYYLFSMFSSDDLVYTIKISTQL